MVKKVFCFDLDGTLCSQVGTNYEAAVPFTERIIHVNGLYAAGHRILIFTARGSSTGLDHRELTASQLAAWNVHHHELILGKPAADIYVDDRGVHSDEYSWGAPSDVGPTDSSL